ncbi:MAG: hypothetical protein JWM19_5828 [Actinomycetia bacterium]|nr:hypothetical protein [Actinomycetes bacterium]
MTDSKIISLARRARERAIASGDADMVARQERALYRAISEQDHYDAAEFAEVEQSVAIGELVRIWRRDNPQTP